MEELNQTTLNDILETVRFIKDNAVTKEEFNKELGVVKGELNKIDNRLTRVESQMVTKEYLDDKLSDLRGDLTILNAQGGYQA